MKTSHIIASVIVAAGLLSGCEKKDEPKVTNTTISSSSSEVFQSSSVSADDTTMNTSPALDNGVEGTGETTDSTTMPEESTTTPTEGTMQ